MKNTRIYRVFPLLLLSVALCPSVMAAVAPDRTNVCSYGAVPNDGADDTAAINAALTAATPTPAPGTSPSRSIYFPPGAYIYMGQMTLAANTSYRIYGDGQGVSTILFTGSVTGINAPNMGEATLNVEGLTLKANTKNCGTAISAWFNESNPSKKFRTATIHNVQIIGSTRDGGYGSFWTNGIYLYKAQNSVIDKVEISGNARDADQRPPGPGTQVGITWASSNDYATTGLQMSSLEIKYMNTALRTTGWVEGLYVFGFEFVFCGAANFPVVDLNSYAPANPTGFHLVNGHLDHLWDGIKVTDIGGVKISKILFIRESTEYSGPGNDVAFNNCTDAIVSQCSFLGAENNIADATGIRLNDAHSVQIAGNYFTRMRPALPSASCIVVQSNSNLVRITNNLFDTAWPPFGSINNRYNDAATDTYYRGNN